MNIVRDLVCIGCPMGCPLKVEMEDKRVLKVTGNACKRGEMYGEKECTNPTRIVTSTVRVDDGEIDFVSVKTEKDIPKGKVNESVKLLENIAVKAPVKIGDIILENILGTGVNFIATKNISRK